MNKYVKHISHTSITFIISFIYLFLVVPKSCVKKMSHHGPLPTAVMHNFYFMFVLFTEKQNVIQLKKGQGVMNTHLCPLTHHYYKPFS